jgi:hypothetical protein
MADFDAQHIRCLWSGLLNPGGAKAPAARACRRRRHVPTVFDWLTATIRSSVPVTRRDSRVRRTILLLPPLAYEIASTVAAR